jgi:hypothetical protein
MNKKPLITMARRVSRDLAGNIWEHLKCLGPIGIENVRGKFAFAIDARGAGADHYQRAIDAAVKEGMP